VQYCRHAAADRQTDRHTHTHTHTHRRASPQYISRGLRLTRNVTNEKDQRKSNKRLQNCAKTPPGES